MNLQKIIKLKNQYSFPDKKPNLKPFYWSLDGGGRDIIKNIIKTQNISLMLEIGVFFGGSALQWLQSSNNLILIGIDPFPNFTNYFIRSYERYKSNIKMYDHSYQSLLEQLRSKNGTYLSVITNLWQYRDRFIPIKNKSPGILYEFKKLDIVPELIYIDTDHQLTELETIKTLFPNTIITGNGWTWSKDGSFPVQEKVEDFAQQYDYQIYTSKGSWILKRANKLPNPALKSSIVENIELPILDTVELNNIQIRSGLGNLNSKLKKEVCKIAYLGASVTAQKQGYRPFLHQWFQDYFQQSHVEINGAIGGVISGAAVFLMDDTVIQYKPDLCFIEYSTVDMSWNSPEVSYAIEGMVRKLKAIDCQICFLYLYRQDREFNASNSVISMYERIAEFYNIPSINVGKYIEVGLKENKIFFESLFRDFAHNNLQGGKFIAKYISNCLQSILLHENKYLKKEFPDRIQYLNSNSNFYANGQIFPINDSMICHWDNYQVGYFQDERLNKRYKYYQINSANKIEFRIKGRLIAITSIIGKNSGIVELITPEKTWEYNFWDAHCHYDRFHARPIYRSFENETNVTLKITEKEIDYSLCRRRVDNLDAIVKQLKIIGLLVCGQVDVLTNSQKC